MNGFCVWIDDPKGGVRCTVCKHEQRRRTLRNCDLVPGAQRAAAEPAKPKIKGPGDYLHDLIKFWTRQNVTPGCGCEKMIRLMNQWGAACLEHLDEIADKMIKEGKKRKLPGVNLPGVELVCKRIIRMAVRKQKKLAKSDPVIPDD